MNIRCLAVVLTICLLSNVLFASEMGVEGVVKDGSGNPLEYVAVALLSKSDSTLVDGAVTGEDGRFIVAASKAPAFLRISAMGFEDYTVDSPVGNLGIITLQPTAYELGEVEVKGARPLVKMASDGLQVAIAGTYLSNAGTAMDVLGKMPFVTKSGTRLEVLGKGVPLVYINGRQVRDQSELEQLSSANIKSVEVVTSPGARYSSEVNSVIRVTTKAPVGEGFSFNDRTTVGYKHYAYLFEQVNLNFRKNGFDLFGMLNYENYRERPKFDNATVQYLSSGVIKQNSNGKDFAKYPVYQGKVGMNYNSDNHNLGFYYDFSYRPSNTDSRSSTSRWLNGNAEDELSYSGDISVHNRQHTLSAYYSGAVGKWQLAGNFDALWQINDRATAENEISTANPVRRFSTDNDVDNRLIAGNISASCPLWKGNLRFGSEISNIYRTDIYSGNAYFIADNDTRIKETSSALFVESSQHFGKASITAGLRWEYTDSKYYLFGVKQEEQSRCYHHLAPSASISMPVGNVATRISYTRKTSRPLFGQLSSAVKYIDRYSYESGNPNLRPIDRHYLSLSASWRDLVVEVEYASINNYFVWQTSPYSDDSDATLVKIENMPRYNSFGAYANYSPVFFSLWRPTFMASVQIQDFKIVHNGSVMKLNKPLGVFRFNNALHLPWDTWLNVDFSARTSGNGENLFLKSRWSCNVGVYKSFAGDAWSIKLQLNDVFDTYREYMVSYDAISRTSAKKIYDTRDLVLTLRYNFNSATSRYKGRGAGNSEKGRF